MANGLLVAQALLAADTLAKKGIEARVIDMHTIKPLDTAALERASHETGAFVVAEEHMHHGGLGSAVAQALVAGTPAPVEYVNLGDRYAESGKPDDLLEKYGMTAKNVVSRGGARARSQMIQVPPERSLLAGGTTWPLWFAGAWIILAVLALVSIWMGHAPWAAGETGVDGDRSGGTGARRVRMVSARAGAAEGAARVSIRGRLV